MSRHVALQASWIRQYQGRILLVLGVGYSALLALRLMLG